ncbi:hypothetical protein [Kitasatospora sp. MBT63]|uniref:hypothetical protein n=1 Tax=Kitasatospora sp. MBT63 TaxID=1444768 RepID=UPI00068FDB79|nr:hypothetical protein [Kitasatospora sp. MBT63]
MSGTTIDRAGPGRVLAGFALLLGLLFAVSYGLGSAVGPVAPGLAPARPGTDGPGAGENGPHGRPAGGDDMSGMTMGSPAPSAAAQPGLR